MNEFRYYDEIKIEPAPGGEMQQLVFVSEDGDYRRTQQISNAELDDLLRLLVERRGLDVAQIVAATQALDGDEQDEVRSRLSALYDTLHHSGDWPEGAVVVHTLAGKYSLVFADVELDAGESHNTFDDAVDHLRIDLDDMMIPDIGDIPVTFYDLRTGLRVELGRADELDNMTEPTESSVTS